MTDTPPFALFVRGPSDEIFALSDTLGFESPTQLDDVDWVSRSQQNLPPVNAGRFWVHGDHDNASDAPSSAQHTLCINAGMAFGTGHHGTTKGCLLIYDDMIEEGFDPARILDLGCGAGTLAIAAAKHSGRTILATDIDPDAIMVTNDNAKINGVRPKIEALVADGFDSPALGGKQFDLIFANILAGPLMALAPAIRKALAPGGRVILSGILNQQAAEVAAAFSAENIDSVARPPIGDWTSLSGRAV